MFPTALFKLFGSFYFGNNQSKFPIYCLMPPSVDETRIRIVCLYLNLLHAVVEEKFAIREHKFSMKKFNFLLH